MRARSGARSTRSGVWMPLCLLFFVPFIDRKRPFRMLHLDLLVLLAFSISLAFFKTPTSASRCRSSIRCSPTCWRACCGSRSGASPARRPSPSACSCPSTWLVVAIVFLLGFRVGLNVTNSNVDRRRLLGRDRRRPPDRRQGALRRASRTTTSTATPTGRSTTTPTSRSSTLIWPWSGQLGRPARRRTAPRSCFDLRDDAAPVAARPAHPRARRWASRWPTAGPHSRSRCSRWSPTPTTRWSRCWWC